jgi:hypothetical protein
VRYWALGIAIAFLSLTSVYGLVMSLCLLAYFVLDNVRLSVAREGTPPTFALTASPRLAGGVALACLVILFCVITLQPPDPNPFSRDWSFGNLGLAALPDVLERFAAGYVPLRPVSAGFWVSSIFPTGGEDNVLVWIVGGGLALLSVAALYPSWRLMLVYLAAIAIMQFFQITRYRGDPRHWGHYFIFLVAACWLLRASLPKRRHVLSTLLLVGMLGFQVESFVAAAVGDTEAVFSGGRQTAAFIRRSHLEDLPLVAGPDWFVITVTGYLRRPYISVETEEVNDTVVFHGRRRGFSSRALVDRAAEVSRERKTPVLVVSNQSLPPAPPGATMDWLFTSKPGTVGDEIFSVYRVVAF